MGVLHSQRVIGFCFLLHLRLPTRARLKLFYSIYHRSTGVTLYCHSVFLHWLRKILSRSLSRSRRRTRGLLPDKTMFPFNQFVAAQYRYSKFGRYSLYFRFFSIGSFLLLLLLYRSRTWRNQSVGWRVRQWTTTARSCSTVDRRPSEARRSPMRYQSSSEFQSSSGPTCFETSSL